MRLLTPDPERFPLPAERFHWRWNRIFLLGLLAWFGLVVVAEILAEADGPLPRVLTDQLPGATVVGLPTSLWILSGLFLPAASYLAGRVRGGRAGVTGRLALGAVAVGLVGALIGLTFFYLGLGPVPLLGGVLVVGFGTVVALAVLGGVSGRGRWPGFGSSIAGVLLLFGGFVGPQVVHHLPPGPWHAVMSDLDQLRDSQAIHLSDTGAYAKDLATLEFESSQGVRIAMEQTPDGWTARGSHVEWDGECALFMGSTPIPPANREGRVLCTLDRTKTRDAVQKRYNLRFMGEVTGAFLLVLLLALRGVARERWSK